MGKALRCVCGHLRRQHRGQLHDKACRAKNEPTGSWTDEDGHRMVYIVVACECESYVRRGS